MPGWQSISPPTPSSHTALLPGLSSNFTVQIPSDCHCRAKTIVVQPSAALGHKSRLRDQAGEGRLGVLFSSFMAAYGKHKFRGWGDLCVEVLEESCLLQGFRRVKVTPLKAGLSELLQGRTGGCSVRCAQLQSTTAEPSSEFTLVTLQCFYLASNQSNASHPSLPSPYIFEPKIIIVLSQSL